MCSITRYFFVPTRGFPGSSVGKESTCNVGDPDWIPGSGRSAGEGIGYPLQYSWVSLVAQLVKNPPAKWETWVLSLGWENPLQKGTATHSSILAWIIPWTVWNNPPTGLQRVGHDWVTLTFTSLSLGAKRKQKRLHRKMSWVLKKVKDHDRQGWEERPFPEVG